MVVTSERAIPLAVALSTPPATPTLGPIMSALDDGGLYVLVSLPLSAYIFPGGADRGCSGRSSLYASLGSFPIDQKHIALDSLDHIAYYDLYIHKSADAGTMYRSIAAESERSRIRRTRLDVVDVIGVRHLSQLIGMVKVDQIPPSMVGFVDAFLRKQQAWTEGVADCRVWTFAIVQWLWKQTGHEVDHQHHRLPISMEQLHGKILRWAARRVDDALVVEKPRPVCVCTSSHSLRDAQDRDMAEPASQTLPLAQNCARA